MAKRSVAGLCLAVSCVFTSSNGWAELVSRWRLDGKYEDVSGKGNNGAPVGVGDRASPRQGSTGKLYIDGIQLTKLGK